jgi:YesN/AraC family two-component response regulator
MTYILIIDDDTVTRLSLRRVLEDAGYDVSEAANGREGVRIFQHTHPDLVITDILMPEQDGLEVIQELLRMAPAVKIIAISGGGQYGGFDYLEVAQRLGAQRMLRKPFAPHVVLEAVQALLQPCT